MILYYSPGACSLASHIGLEASGAQFTAQRTTIIEGATKTPEYLAINPRARVPALDIGSAVVTESVAILNFIADSFAKRGSVPRGDAHAAARCNELLAWFASSVHVGFAQVWRPERFIADEAHYPLIQQAAEPVLDRYFAELELLCGDGWLVDRQFTAADSYAAIFFRWGRRIGRDMSRYPRWAALSSRVVEEPAAQRAIEREGLDPAEFRLPD